MRLRLLLPLIVALAVSVVPAAAKDYSAERYDVRIQVRDDGSIRVTETIVLRFEDGTFSEFFREIPTRRTDGIEILEASINGRRLPWGDDVGQAEVSGRNRRKVQFRFAPVENTRQTFTVVYVVDGAVRRGDGADRLIWRALPSDHNYPIDVATITVEAPVPPLQPLGVRSRRIAASTMQASENGAVVTASDVRDDGWVELDLRFTLGTVISTPPVWQQRRLDAQESAPWWLAGGGMALVLGLIPFLALRTRYDKPEKAPASDRGVPRPPDTLPVGAGGMLAAGGQARSAHALATLFALANRGVVAIAESREKRLGQRKFEVRLLDRRARQAPLDQTVIDQVFTHKGESQDHVPLLTASRRLAGHMRPVREALQAVVTAEGLWDADRAHLRRQHHVAAGILLALAGLSAAGAALLVPDYQGWPFLVSAGLAIAAVLGFAFGSSITPLSDRGVRRAAGWCDYRRHLKDVARGKTRLDGEPGRLLATAVALGLAAEWSRYLKKHGSALPEWFRAWSADDSHAAFIALVAATSASTSSSGGASGAGAAAGGGASGAS